LHHQGCVGWCGDSASGEVYDRKRAQVVDFDDQIVGRSEDYAVVEATNSALPDTTYLMVSNKGELYEINDSGNF